MQPWYKVAIPRKGVREGRSFNPDEFAIALEQAVAGSTDNTSPVLTLTTLYHALSAFYPRGSEEERLVDAMLRWVPR